MKANITLIIAVTALSMTILELFFQRLVCHEQLKFNADVSSTLVQVKEAIDAQVKFNQTIVEKFQRKPPTTIVQ
jgi:hypothetical protein